MSLANRMYGFLVLHRPGFRGSQKARKLKELRDIAAVLCEGGVEGFYLQPFICAKLAQRHSVELGEACARPP
jgi:hypothetical protein